MGKRVCVAIPMRPTLAPVLQGRAMELAARIPAANPDYDVTVLMDATRIEASPGDSHKWSKVCRARNVIVEQTRAFAAFDYVMWVDADLVDYPANLLTRLIAANPTGAAAPLVLVEGEPTWFYDRTAFILKGMDQYQPANPAHIPGRNVINPSDLVGDIAELDCVGAIYTVPATVYRDGTRHEDHAAFTDHYNVLKKLRDSGGTVVVMTSVTAWHAFLPKYGESW